MLASDVNNPAFAGAINPDSILSVWFLSKPIQNNFRTVKEGRPIFEDVIYIHIEAPGDRASIIERPIYDQDKERFPLQWAAWQNKHGEDAREMGTPLSAWPILTAAQAEELKAIKFRTVESIAGASDAALQKIGMVAGMAPHAFRQRAQNFLAVAQDSAFAEKKDAELKAAQEREGKMAAEMQALKEQVARLTEIATAPEEQSRKRMGWPKGKKRKVQAEATT